MTSENPRVPGEAMETSSTMMGAGCSMLQSFTPLKGIHQHVCGIHFYDGNLKRQVIAHHYCSHLNEEMRQCAIFDSDQSNARLIGVEYIISERLFHSLPEDEKKYWHSHLYEVKSGMLVLPNVPVSVENKDMEKLVSTYGKTWHLWQVDRGDTLPLGPANLMMAFTADGQVDPLLIGKVDKDLSVNWLERRKAREYIPTPVVSPLAGKGLTGNNPTSTTI